MKTAILALLIIQVIPGCNAANPVITDFSSLERTQFSEDLELNSVLGNVEAFDPDGDDIVFELTGQLYSVANINATGFVILEKDQLNYETNQEYTWEVTVRKANDIQSRDTVKSLILVRDVNDVFPEWFLTRQITSLPENSALGTTVNRVRAEDNEASNSEIIVTCLTLSEDDRLACQKFGLDIKRTSNVLWISDVVLQGSLDYEEKARYTLRLSAFDGVNTEVVGVIFTVIDINDAPPVFDDIESQEIPEENPIGTFIVRVNAVDGDVNNQREIRYSLIDANDVFQIDPRTGDISNKARLDFDDPTGRVQSVEGGVFDVTVVAQEVVDPVGPVLGNDAETRSELELKIRVFDINDNSPTFDKSNYETSVDENTPDNSFITNLNIRIDDIDGPQYNSFRITLLDHVNIFRIEPNTGQELASPVIYVSDSSLIDYESGTRDYELRIKAENEDRPDRSSTATVTVNVVDINDVVPTFKNLSYSGQVREDAPEGTSILTVQAEDIEEGLKGTAGILYRLSNRDKELFTIENTTGIIKVGPTCQPGDETTRRCLDFETKRSHSLTVYADDNKEQPLFLSNSVKVNIDVIDVNDIKPVPFQDEYVAYILEGETRPIDGLTIQVLDQDTVGKPISFRFANPNDQSSQFWKITQVDDPDTGNKAAEITAVNPIKYTDAPDQSTGIFQFIVFIDDTAFTSSALVTINVIDINDNAPEFTSINGRLELSIPENIPGGSSIYTLTVNDVDAPTTDNGRVYVSISNGALGKFVVGDTTLVGSTHYANISTAPNARFNFDQQNRYEMTILARDGGTPLPQTGTVTFIVNILDRNTNDPVFDPTISSITVREDTAIGTSVWQAIAIDRDSDKRLTYRLNPRDALPENSDFRDLFTIDQDTGIVKVNKKLNRDEVYYISNEILAIDENASPQQTGSGVLFIRISEFNDQDPYFADDAQQPTSNYVFDVLEDRQVSFSFGNMICIDEDDNIEEYRIEQKVPGRFPVYIGLSRGTGIPIIEQGLDYEKLERIELQVFCSDDGDPSRSASASVTVNIMNVNDNFPIFQQGRFDAKVLEGSGENTFVQTVLATDGDKEDYGVLRYSIDDPNFRIDEISGEIFLTSQANFDRETVSSYSVIVVAKDSPNTQNPYPSQLTSSVELVIEIEDINDNCPVFTESAYFGKVPEIAGLNTDIIDLRYTDRDTGINTNVQFDIRRNSGNPPDAEKLFRVSDKGRIATAADLRKREGDFSFNITVRNTVPMVSGITCQSDARVTVTVERSRNSVPIWFLPPRKDVVIMVLEEQYLGMEIYDCLARDPDKGKTGVIEYFFRVRQNELTNEIPNQFSINKHTGMISAEAIYDMEGPVTSYILNLVALDSGNPPASSETTIIVNILDVNDNDPVFPTNDGKVIPLVIPKELNSLREGETYANEIGQCSATDKDTLTDNNLIYYRLLTSNEQVSKYIRVEKETCKIFLINPIDYEETPSISFNIWAYNPQNDDFVKRNKRATNPSVLPVTVLFQDVNDNEPTFTKSEYFACASIESNYRETILTVQAIDADDTSTSGEGIQYGIKDNQTDLFVLTKSSNLGELKTNTALRFVDNIDTDRTRVVVLEAYDVSKTGTATANIFIVDSDNYIKLKLDQPLATARAYRDQIVSTLNADKQFVHVCDPILSKYERSDGTLSDSITTVRVAAITRSGNNFEILSSEDLRDRVLSRGNILGDIEVSKVEVDEEKDEFELEENAVLAILIIGILLLFLAFLLCCIACYCIRRTKRRKIKKLNAKQHTIVQVTPENVETSFNPVYNNPGMAPEDPEYAVVKKKDSPSVILPVVIPAPENLEPVKSSEPELPPPVSTSVFTQDPDEPVIETEVLGEPDLEPEELEKPEFEPINYEPPPPPPPENLDDEIVLPPADDEIGVQPIDDEDLGYHGAPPSALADENIEVEIRESPPGTPIEKAPPSYYPSD